MRLFARFLLFFSFVALSAYASTSFSFDLKDALKKTDNNNNRLKNISVRLYTPDYAGNMHSLNFATSDDSYSFSEMKEKISSPRFFNYDKKNSGLNFGSISFGVERSGLDLNYKLAILPSLGLYSGAGMKNLPELSLCAGLNKMENYEKSLRWFSLPFNFSGFHQRGAASIGAQFSKFMFDSYRGRGLMNASPLNIVSGLKGQVSCIALSRAFYGNV